MATTIASATRPRHAHRTPMRAAQIDDALAFRGAFALRRTAPSVSQLSRERGLSRSRVSHWLADDARHCPFTVALRELRWASEGHKTNPLPFMVEMNSAALEAYLASKPLDWLVRRWKDLDSREHRLEADENQLRTLRSDDRDAYRRALKAEAEAQIELAAIDQILEEVHGVDPAREDA